MNGRLLLLAGSAAFGLVMRAGAQRAADPGWGWVLWVVNWGALWVILPFVLGRRSVRASAATLLGVAAGAMEVATYYGVENLAGFKAVWLIAGAAICGVVGLFGRVSQRYEYGLVAVPVLMILEPVGLAVVFTLLGRHLGIHWFWSGVAEVAVGVIAVGVAAASATSRPRGRAL